VVSCLSSSQSKGVHLVDNWYRLLSFLFSDSIGDKILPVRLVMRFADFFSLGAVRS